MNTVNQNIVIHKSAVFFCKFPKVLKSMEISGNYEDVISNGQYIKKKIIIVKGNDKSRTLLVNILFFLMYYFPRI